MEEKRKVSKDELKKKNIILKTEGLVKQTRWGIFLLQERPYHLMNFFSVEIPKTEKTTIRIRLPIALQQ
jgi:hypothetical protein